MINKENEQIKTLDETPVDTATLDISAHIKIVDVDTGEILVDKRG